MSALIYALDTLDKYWDGKLPIDVVSLCNNANVQLFFYPKLVMSSWFIYMGKEPVIYLNKNKSINKLRYTTIYEFGRYILGFKPRELEPYDRDVTLFTDHNSNTLKQFTTEILLPRKAICFYVDRADKSLSELANLFGVSDVAIAIRMRQLGLINAY